MAMDMYSNVRPLHRSPALSVRSRDRMEYDDEPRMSGGCPTWEGDDPDDVASPKAALAIQQLLDMSMGKQTSQTCIPGKQARAIASTIVREATSPRVNRNGKRKAPVAFTRVVESSGGAATFTNNQFVLPAGTTAVIEVRLNETYRAHRLVLQHPASDDGLIVLDLKVAGRSQWFDAGPMAADAFDRDTQCPIDIDGDYGKPGTPYQLTITNNNPAGTPDLAFTALLHGFYLIGDCY